jgi:hypothetical protein
MDDDTARPTSPLASPPGPTAAVSPTPTTPGPDLNLRSGLRRFSTGLIVFGVAGLIVAAIGLAMLLYVGGRIGTVAERTSTQVETVIATLDRTSTALSDAGDTALSFALTLERTPPVVRQASDTLSNLQGNLRSIQQQLGAVSVLGARPLSGVSSIFGDMATQIEGLDVRLEGLAASLDDNKAALLANADSLSAIGVQLGSVADDLRTGIVQDSLSDVQVVLTVLLFLLVAWTAVPAAGALWIGWWLRRELPPVAAAA